MFYIIVYTLALYPVILVMMDYNRYVEREIKKISENLT